MKLRKNSVWQEDCWAWLHLICDSLYSPQGMQILPCSVHCTASGLAWNTSGEQKKSTTLQTLTLALCHSLSYNDYHDMASCSACTMVYKQLDYRLLKHPAVKANGTVIDVRNLRWQRVLAIDDKSREIFS